MKFDYQSGVDTDITAEFLDRYNKEIDEAGAQIDAGNYLIQDEVEKFFAQRRKKPNGD